MTRVAATVMQELFAVALTRNPAADHAPAIAVAAAAGGPLSLSAPMSMIGRDRAVASVRSIW